MSNYRVEIPFGDDGVRIDASPEQPKWIQAVKHDLHSSHETSGVLFLDHPPTLITAPTIVRRSDGHPSVVRVTTVRTDSDARHANADEIKEAA